MTQLGTSSGCQVSRWPCRIPHPATFLAPSSAGLSADRPGDQLGRRYEGGLIREREAEEERRRTWRVSCAVAVQLVQADTGMPGSHCRGVLVGAVREPGEQVQSGGGAADARRWK